MTLALRPYGNLTLGARRSAHTSGGRRRAEKGIDMSNTGLGKTAKRLRIAGIVAGSLLLVLTVVGWLWMSYVPSDLDLSTTLPTENGLYTVSYEPSQTPIPVNQLHTWTLTLTSADGQPLEHAHVSVDGDMPQHGHGLPTRPVVTEYLGEGRYLVEGVKFQMGGWWVMDFVVESDAGTDKVRFNFVLD